MWKCTLVNSAKTMHSNSTLNFCSLSIYVYTHSFLGSIPQAGQFTYLMQWEIFLPLDLSSPSDLSVLETLSDSGPQSSGDEGMGGGGGGGGGGGKRESKRKLLEGAEPYAPKRRSTRVS